MLNETDEIEKRVCLVPSHVEQLAKKGAKISVVENAGLAAGFSNASYEQAVNLFYSLVMLLYFNRERVSQRRIMFGKMILFWDYSLPKFLM